MIKKISILLIVISGSAMLIAQEPLSSNQQAVQQTVIKLFDALSNRDSTSLKNYCTADITLYEYGQVWNIDTLILKAIAQNRATDFKRTNSFNFINTTTGKNIAWVTYHLQSSITSGGKPVTLKWLETIVLVKERKKWKVKHLHSTFINRS